MQKPHQKIWIFIWLAIYASFLLLDLILPPDSLAVGIIKVTGLIINIIYVSKLFPSDRLLQFTLLLTLISDFALIIFNSPTPGLFCFCIVQALYFTRLTSKPLKTIAPFVLTSCLILLVSFIFRYDPIIPIATQYGLTIAANLVLSIHQYIKTKTKISRFVMCGFILFSICDCFVMLSFLTRTDFLPIPHNHLFDYLAWAFYYPSQILLANSAKPSSNP